MDFMLLTSLGFRPYLDSKIVQGLMCWIHTMCMMTRIDSSKPILQEVPLPHQTLSYNVSMMVLTIRWYKTYQMQAQYNIDMTLVI